MNSKMLSILECPTCRRALNAPCGDESDEYLSCQNGHRVIFSSGVFEFDVNEQHDLNNWSNHIEGADYTDIENSAHEYYESCDPQDIERQEEVMESMIEALPLTEANTIVDICTGMGDFVTHLFPELPHDSSLICVDLSAAILRYVHEKKQSQWPDLESCLSYISADIAQLPLIDESVDVVTSYAGIGNMYPSKISSSIQEIYRVLKSGGVFIDATTVFKPGAASLVKTEAFFSELDPEGHFSYGSIESIQKTYVDSPFPDVTITELWSDIASCTPKGDVVPVPGDWYAEVLVEAKKT